MITCLNELCEYIGHITGDTNENVDLHQIMLVLANICSQISVRHTKYIERFFAISFKNLFTRRNYTAEAEELLELQNVANGILFTINELVGKTDGTSVINVYEISDTYNRQLCAMQDFLIAESQAIGQLKVIAEKLAFKATGACYSITEYNNDVEQFKILEDHCYEKTNRLEAILKGWC